MKVLQIFVHYAFKHFWQFLNKNLCFGWLNYICTRATQASVAGPRDCEYMCLVTWPRCLGKTSVENQKEIIINTLTRTSQMTNMSPQLNTRDPINQINQ